MYKILIESNAEKDTNKLDKISFERVIKNILKLSNEPRPMGCKKLKDSVNDWRIRVGDYRVIYDINDDNKEIRIMRVRHRREAYR